MSKNLVANKVLTINEDRTITIDDYTKVADGALYNHSKGKALLKRKDNNLDTFLATYVVKGDSEYSIYIQDLYRAYTDYCNKHNLPVYSIPDFIKKLESMKCDFSADGSTVYGVQLREGTPEHNGYKPGSRREMFYLIRKKRFGKDERIPVWLNIAGTFCNVGFDDLQSYIHTNNNEIIATDENTIARLLSGHMSLGSKFGRDVKLETVQKMAKISVIINILLIMFIFVLMMMGGIGGNTISWNVLG